MCRKGDHVRLVLTPRIVRGLQKVRFPLVLGRLSVDVFWMSRFETNFRSKLLNVQCVNRFEPLVSQACNGDELMEGLSGDEHAHSGLLEGDKVRA